MNTVAHYPIAIPNLDDVLAERMVNLEFLKGNPQGQKEEIALCSKDVVHFVRNWAWTYDPREKLSSLPFVPVPKQVELLEWVRDREESKSNGVIPKSRATGVTYTCCAYAVWAWLFRDGFACGFGSRVIPYVDSSNNPKSIFWKLRYLIERLPKWMLPEGYNPKKHSTHAKLYNPERNSYIIGEGGPNIGRGDRTSLYFLDEAAHVEHAEKVEAALSMTTNCRIDLSTPLGNSNVFAQKVLGGKVAAFWVRWQDIPFLTQAMYDSYKDQYGATITAQEWDIDFTASESGICIPAIWVMAAVDFLNEAHELFAEVIAEAGLDVGEEHDLSVFLSRKGPCVIRIEDWTGTTTTQTTWMAKDLAVEEAARLMRFDAGGIGSGVRGPFKDFDGELPFVPLPIQFGSKPTDTVWPDKMTSKQKFKNLRAEMWWALRTRFEKTYEYVEKGIEHPIDELISIPRHPRLIAQLSMPKYRYTDVGKIILQPKEELPISPDFADACVLAFAPVQVKEFWIR